MKTAILAALLAALLLTGCSAAKPIDRAAVQWGDYTKVLKTKLDGWAKDGNCRELQAEFDYADANGEATRNRTGHSNTKLMEYIHELMNEAGCYK